MTRDRRLNDEESTQKRVVETAQCPAVVHSHVRPRCMRHRLSVIVRMADDDQFRDRHRQGPGPIELHRLHASIDNDRPATNALARMSGARRKLIRRLRVPTCRPLVMATTAAARFSFASRLHRTMPPPAQYWTGQQYQDQQAGNRPAHTLIIPDFLNFFHRKLSAEFSTILFIMQFSTAHNPPAGIAPWRLCTQMSLRYAAEGVTWQRRQRFEAIK